MNAASSIPGPAGSSIASSTEVSAVEKYSLSHVSNDDLHASTRRLVGRSNQLLAALLAHLGEVEARGIHRERASMSLYTYCIYELRMSEDAACRRIQAARIARRLPEVLERLAAGEIHLSGLLMIGPYLTPSNHVEVLDYAKHRSKREIARLVRMVHPVRDVPALVEPLGPAAPTAEFVSSLASKCPVRDLLPGERPKEWIDPAASGAFAGISVSAAPVSNVSNDEVPEAKSDAAEPTHADAAPANPSANPAPNPLLAPQRYKIQFTATEEYVALLDEAKDLLPYAVPSRSLQEVHLRAMRLLVADLKKRKFAALDRPRSKATAASVSDDDSPRQRGSDSDADSDHPRQHGSDSDSDHPRQRGSDSDSEPDHPRQRCQRGSRHRGRHVPAAVRRAVWERDAARCTYVDVTTGERCRETAWLEFDHAHPHALGGATTASNMRLRCRAHNALGAEQDFGREFMERKKHMER